MNILEYVKWEKRRLDEVPFSEVDSLVLSMFAYFAFENEPELFPSFESRRSFKELVPFGTSGNFRSTIFASPEKEGVGLMRALAKSSRFKGVEVGFFSYVLDPKATLQFCAMSFFLPDGSTYLAFRGTDGSIAGWREDFELSFRTVESQTMAAAYLQHVSTLVDGPLRIGGHSKGGNLAEYAALMAPEDLFARIVGVYNHEGPGFVVPPSSRYNTPEYNRILRKTVVESSGIGMIFEQRRLVHVVEANGIGLVQHGPFFWVVSGGSFVYRESLNPSALVANRVFSEWFQGLTVEECAAITDEVFRFAEGEGVLTFAELVDKIKDNPFIIKNALPK